MSQLSLTLMAAKLTSPFASRPSVFSRYSSKSSLSLRTSKQVSCVCSKSDLPPLPIPLTALSDAVSGFSPAYFSNRPNLSSTVTNSCRFRGAWGASTLPSPLPSLNTPLPTPLRQASAA